ncbi:hypothetical protein N6B72_21040 [Chryseobacterium soli]|uniref:hypothetical protein n=1 Tax=Chryseobacterium soli TaxID=445961 RepID=UPI002953D932|nr:hypothetical protein [Chryseobacterium soli]MDV7699413.1 hypothetical protein [Chryseobacterium soli]
MMLVLFIFANARENNDSVDQKNINQDPEKASIFISEETSIYGKEIIYNANYIVVRKKKSKTNYKLSLNKNKPAKTKNNIPVIKRNFLKNITLYNPKELFPSTDQKAQCIRLIERHELGLTVIDYTDIQLHYFRMILLSAYNQISIEHDKNIILSIRPPPANDAKHIQTIKRIA